MLYYSHYNPACAMLLARSRSEKLCAYIVKQDAAGSISEINLNSLPAALAHSILLEPAGSEVIVCLSFNELLCAERTAGEPQGLTRAAAVHNGVCSITHGP